MIDGLLVVNLKKGSAPVQHSGEVFVLQTCQRTVIVGLGDSPLNVIPKNSVVDQFYYEKEAYLFLLETILGLKSQVMAEYEVVNQFKDAYQKFANLSNRNTHILTLLEKLFKDQKKIRSEHLTEIGQLSYAGIARKLIHRNVENLSEEVLILGSGNLAQDTLNLLVKRFNVGLSARSPEKLQEMLLNSKTHLVPWMDVESYKKYKFIVNTIGTETILFDSAFFANWQDYHRDTPTKIFIDLGSPEAISTALSTQDGVYRLHDIFQESTKLGQEKMEKIENAKKAALVRSNERQNSFTLNLPFGWEELQFA